MPCSSRTGKFLTRSVTSRIGAAVAPLAGHAEHRRVVRRLASRRHRRSRTARRRRAPRPAGRRSRRHRTGMQVGRRVLGADLLRRARSGRGTRSPTAARSMFGGAPGIGVQPVAPDDRQGASRPDRVRVGRAAGRGRGPRPARRLRPAYITCTRSAMRATTPRSWVMNTTPARSSRCTRWITSRIWAWTVTSSAVVGSSAISTSGSLAIAMAIITRWRMPPENSCGYWRARVPGCGMPTRSSSSTDLVRGLLASAASGGRRSSRRSGRRRGAPGSAPTAGPGRSWRSSCRATDAGQLLAARRPAPAVDLDRAGDLRASLGSRPMTAEERHRLARAGLADDGDDLAGLDVEVDAADRLDRAVIGGEGDPQSRISRTVAQPSAQRRSAVCLGSNASRKPSPTKLTAARSMSTSDAHGKTTSHQLPGDGAVGSASRLPQLDVPSAGSGRSRRTTASTRRGSRRRPQWSWRR